MLSLEVFSSLSEKIFAFLRSVSHPRNAVIILVVHSHYVSSFYLTPFSFNLSILYGIVDHTTLSVGDVWEDYYDASMDMDDGERRYHSPNRSYVSQVLRDMNDEEIESFVLEHTREQSAKDGQLDGLDLPHAGIEGRRQAEFLRRSLPDPLWSQIRLEAQRAITLELDAGQQLHQHVLRHPSLMDALASIISHEIATELMPATALLSLVMDQLTWSDEKAIYLDLIASANRKPSNDSTALNALLFHQGLHALVCYRVAHRLWQAGRTGLAYYIQSTVSSQYAADIHPAAEMEGGIYLNVGGGVVIGETARIGRDVTILQGVTLGGTGKEVGDRHPKIEDEVILHCGATVLGNIRVGKGAIITAKSIVTKEVPDRARVSGVPATVKSYRELREEGYQVDEFEGEEECDLDCEIADLYEDYFSELDALAKMELS